MNALATLCTTDRYPALARRSDTKTPTDASTGRRLRDRQYVVMSEAFETSGGLVDCDALVRRMRKHWDQPISRLARWIIMRRVVSFAWQSQLMLPMFQFDPATMTVRPDVSQVIAELSDGFDDWGLALWFAQPNTWLGGQAPASLIGAVDAPGIGDAARADRFVARG
jgi:hypothetical protein